MTWSGTYRGDTAVLITPGYLPDRTSIDLAEARWFDADTVDGRGVVEDAQRTAWLLSRLARRHIRRNYKVWQGEQNLQLGTWVIDKPVKTGSPLDGWFELPAATDPSFRVYLHAYPVKQLGRTFRYNAFHYPHQQMGTRRGSHRGMAELRRESRDTVDKLVEMYNEGARRIDQRLIHGGHNFHYSEGCPAR